MTAFRVYKVSHGPNPESREGDIPYWCEFSDGSWYSALRVDDTWCQRAYCGPVFGSSDVTLERFVCTAPAMQAMTAAPKQPSPNIRVSGDGNDKEAA